VHCQQDKRHLHSKASDDRDCKRLLHLSALAERQGERNQALRTAWCSGASGRQFRILRPRSAKLVELALRDLSPSTNDPFSAMAVVDRLTVSLRKIMQRSTPQSVWTDDDGTVRLLAPGSTFADTVEEAFRQLRQHSQNQPAVLIRLVESLGQLLAQADATQRRALQKGVEIILETGRRHIAQKEDLKVLEERSRPALAKSERSVHVSQWPLVDIGAEPRHVRS
jgi:hypothetical protein